mmetsp:Transcript_49117/g.126832  ORF Transcript_49117/g.126832 Transcript_49117/m.126832 type:complete len:98 (+) Transcript_49117:218-511(+)
MRADRSAAASSLYLVVSFSAAIITRTCVIDATSPCLATDRSHLLPLLTSRAVMDKVCLSAYSTVAITISSPFFPHLAVASFFVPTLFLHAHCLTAGK